MSFKQGIATLNQSDNSMLQPIIQGLYLFAYGWNIKASASKVHSKFKLWIVSVNCKKWAGRTEEVHACKLKIALQVEVTYIKRNKGTNQVVGKGGEVLTFNDGIIKYLINY